MKKLFVLLSTIFSVHVAIAQYFEGYVKYVHQLEITDTTLAKNDVFLSYNFGSSSILYIKGTDFRWTFSGCQMESQTYLASSNLLYEKYPKNDTLYTHSAGVENEVIIKDEIKESKVNVLGYKCQLLTVKSKFPKDNAIRGRMYYFAKKYPLHPNFFKKFKMNNNDQIFAKMGYLPLRFTMIYPGFRISYHAIEVKETKVNEKLFDLSNKKTKPLQVRK
ncbi:MAG: hypothetical protein OHK0045_19320 [Raineya sp.]